MLVVTEGTMAEDGDREERGSHRQRLVDAETNTGVRLNSADDQQLLVIKEVPPQRPVWRPSVNHEESLQIKEEEEEYCISQKEADKNPGSSQLHRRNQNEQNTKDSERIKSLSSDGCVRPGSRGRTEDGDDHGKKTSEAQCLKTIKIITISNDMSDDADEQQMMVIKEEVAREQMEWRPSFEYDDEEEEDEPAHAHIKEEEEDVCIKQEGSDIIAVIVKSEEELESIPDHCDDSEISSATEDSEDEWTGTGEPPSLKTAASLGDSGEIKRNADGKHSCSVCGKGFAYKSVLLIHENTHLEEKPFSCMECGKRFTQKGKLKVHMRIHTGEKPFICSECGKTFTQKSSLKAHERIHTGEKPFVCCDCGKGFTEKSSLKIHERIHTGEKPFACSICGKIFRRKNEMVIHMRLHTGEKSCSCPVCGKTFPQKSSLKIHERTHTGEKPFSCSECGKSFIYKSSLKVHEKHHTGEKPFSCPECGKGFTKKSSLTMHARLHTGEKPFCCSACEKRFTRKDELLKHMTIHTGEKPFSCSYCGKSFTQKASLWKHEKSHV